MHKNPNLRLVFAEKKGFLCRRNIQKTQMSLQSGLGEGLWSQERDIGTGHTGPFCDWGTCGRAWYGSVWGRGSQGCGALRPCGFPEAVWLCCVCSFFYFWCHAGGGWEWGAALALALFVGHSLPFCARCEAQLAGPNAVETDLGPHGGKSRWKQFKK